MNENTEDPQSVADQLTEMFGPIIHATTRADLLAAEELIPVPVKLAQQAGFLLPMAFTAAAWADAVAWSDETDTAKGVFTGQDQTGRLWDVLYLSSLAMRRSRNEAAVTVELYRVPPTGPVTDAELISLRVEIGPDDDGGPVLTVLLPHED